MRRLSKTNIISNEKQEKKGDGGMRIYALED